MHTTYKKKVDYKDLKMLIAYNYVRMHTNLWKKKYNSCNQV